MLWLDRKVTAERFWAPVYAPHDLNTDFYDLSNIRSGLAGRPSIIASNAIHTTDAHRLDDAGLVQRTRRELLQFAPQAGDARVLHARAHRIPMAVSCAALGTESRRPPTAAPCPACSSPATGRTPGFHSRWIVRRARGRWQPRRSPMPPGARCGGRCSRPAQRD